MLAALMGLAEGTENKQILSDGGYTALYVCRTRNKTLKRCIAIEIG